MKAYGSKRSWNESDDFIKKAYPAFSDTKANKNRATRSRCKKTLKVRGRRWKIE